MASLADVPQEVAGHGLLTGKVELRSMATSLVRALDPEPPPTSLAREMAAGLAKFAGPTAILIAENDRTAQVFLSHWDKADDRLRKCPGASHSFVEPQARLWLQGQILAALRAFD